MVETMSDIIKREYVRNLFHNYYIGLKCKYYV